MGLEGLPKGDFRINQPGIGCVSYRQQRPPPTMVSSAHGVDSLCILAIAALVDLKKPALHAAPKIIISIKTGMVQTYLAALNSVSCL